MCFLIHCLVLASVFGEQNRLEAMPPERKSRWTKEIDWLLSVTDHIVEFVPSQQGNMEIMKTQQRKDLHMNIPALRKLDAILVACLDNFKGQNEFYYASKDASEAEKGTRKDDKWWLPAPKVPPNGLSDVTRKWLHFQKDSANQVLKAAMAINAMVLSEMEVPENYIESLPKNGRASLGDSIYKSITVEYFDPDLFLSSLDLSSEHKILDIKNRIEASIVIWKRKMNNKEQKSLLGSSVSQEKRELFEERAETILLILKQRFPGLPQSALDISKIQYNKDVGHAILESYSRILESLAFTVISRIEDVLHADTQAQNSSTEKKRDRCLVTPNKAAADDQSPADGPISTTLLDFMGWNIADQADTEQKKDSADETNDPGKHTAKVANISTTPKKVSYIEKLEHLGGLRSPTERH
uniref:PRONE domain-containing protein n=1 Tax=Kalanchoe fedtschenkoi TaxID=63787 RepID=A0A7N0VJ84_KALFE